MHSRHIDLLIDELGKELELSGLRLGEEQTCSIATGNGLEIVLNYLEDDDLLVTYASLGSIPDAKREAVYEALLKGNFGWETARGTTLSTTGRGREAVLQAYHPVASLDADALSATLDHFSRWASLWAEIIRDIDTNDAPGSAADLPPDPSMFV